MKTDLILKFKQNLFSKVIWSSIFNSRNGDSKHYHSLKKSKFIYIRCNDDWKSIVTNLGRGSSGLYFNTRFKKRFPDSSESITSEIVSKDSKF